MFSSPVSHYSDRNPRNSWSRMNYLIMEWWFSISYTQIKKKTEILSISIKARNKFPNFKALESVGTKEVVGKVWISRLLKEQPSSRFMILEVKRLGEGAATEGIHPPKTVVYKGFAKRSWNCFFFLITDQTNISEVGRLPEKEACPTLLRETWNHLGKTKTIPLCSCSN